MSAVQTLYTDQMDTVLQLLAVEVCGVATCYPWPSASAGFAALSAAMPC